MLMSMKKKPKNYDYFLPNMNQMKNFFMASVRIGLEMEMLVISARLQGY